MWRRASRRNPGTARASPACSCAGRLPSRLRDDPAGRSTCRPWPARLSLQSRSCDPRQRLGSERDNLAEQPRAARVGRHDFLGRPAEFVGEQRE